MFWLTLFLDQCLCMSYYEWMLNICPWNLIVLLFNNATTTTTSTSMTILLLYIKIMFIIIITSNCWVYTTSAECRPTQINNQYLQSTDWWPRYQPILTKHWLVTQISTNTYKVLTGDPDINQYLQSTDCWPRYQPILTKHWLVTQISTTNSRQMSQTTQTVQFQQMS